LAEGVAVVTGVEGAAEMRPEEVAVVVVVVAVAAQQ
jgi:hypothetical protein